MEHTPTPWAIGASGLSIVQKEKGLIVAYVGSREDLSPAELEANAARIVACVNAMEGIKDPKKFIDFARTTKLKETIKMFDERDHLIKERDELLQELSEAKELIDLLKIERERGYKKGWAEKTHAFKTSK